MNWLAMIFLGLVLSLACSLILAKKDDDKSHIAKRLGTDVDTMQSALVVINSFCTILIAIWVNRLTSQQEEAARKREAEKNQKELKEDIEAFNATIRQKGPVIQIDCAYSFFRGDSQILVSGSSYKFWISPLGEDGARFRTSLSEVNPKFSFNRPSYFSHGNQLTAFHASVSIPNFELLLTKAQDEAKRDFLDNGRHSYRKYYNADKFGLFELSTTRLQQTEQPLIRIQTYQTDYFTHLTMRHLVKLLDKEQPGFLDGTEPGQLVSRFPFLFTSLGINMMIITKEKHGLHCLLIQKRSMHSPLQQHHHKWHVSLNEGFSVMDVSPDTQRPSLDVCFTRGLLEELGIPAHAVLSHGFFDIFLVRSVWEIGVAGIALLSLSFRELVKHRKAAPNDAMENDSEFEIVEYSPEALKIWRDDNSKLKSDALNYCLDLLIARQCPLP